MASTTMASTTTTTTRVFASASARAPRNARRTTAGRRGSIIIVRASGDTAESSSESPSTTASDTTASSDWMVETIAGRCAMLGYALGASREVTESMTMMEQSTRHGFGVVATCALVAWASTKPFEFNPQEYSANPMELKGKRGMSGFAAMEELNLNCDVERAHGRLAMAGFAGTALAELILGRGVFGG